MRRATNTINYGGTLPFARCERMFRSEGYALHTPDRAVRRRCRASDPWRATSSVRTGRKTESEAVANHPRRRGVRRASCGRQLVLSQVYLICRECLPAPNSGTSWRPYPGSIRKSAPPRAGSSPPQTQTAESPHKFQPQTSRPPSESKSGKGQPQKVAGFYSATQPQNAAAPWPTIAPPRTVPR
jgi:hypothetical protein